jgi:hypothetical protein
MEMVSSPGRGRGVPDSSSRGIFLSYRREDAGPYARLLQRELSERFPDAQVFMDLDSIEAGLPFAEVIRDAVDSLARNHALVDGNKRLALAPVIPFYGVNGRRLTLTNDEAYDLVIDVAAGHLDSVTDIAARLRTATESRS